MKLKRNFSFILKSRISSIGVLGTLFSLDLFFSIYGWFALVSLIEVFIILLFVSSKVLREKLIKEMDLPVIALGCFLFLIVVSMAWGIAPIQDRMEDLFSWRKILLFPIALIVFKQEHFRVRFFIFFIFYTSVFAASSWGDFYFDIFPALKADELVENNVVQGIIFSFSAFSILYFSYARIGFFGRYRILSILLMAALAGNVLMVSTSRSGYLVFIVCVIVAGLFLYRRFTVLLTFLTTTLFTVLLVWNEVPSSEIRTAVHEAETHNEPGAVKTSIGMRLVLWKNTIDMIKERPILGTGAGSFSMRYAEMVDGIDNWRGEVSDDPHNQYLHIWAEYGIFALLVFLVFLMICSFRFSAGGTGLLGLVILLGISASSLSSGHFGSFVEGRIFWIGTGVALAGHKSLIEKQIESWSARCLKIFSR